MDTPYFPRATPPVRPGVYKASREDLVKQGATEPYAYVFQEWDGNNWLPHRSYGFYGREANMIWCGQTEQSK